MLTESRLPGLGHVRDPRLEPGGARATRRGDRGDRPGEGWSEGDHGHGPALPLPRPRRAPASSSSTSRSATCRPSTCARALKNVPQRHVDRGAAVKRLDHVNVLAADVRRQPARSRRAARLPAVRAGRARRRQRGRRLDERVDRRPRADLHAPTRRRPRPPAPPGLVLGRHARGVACAPPTCSSTPTSRSRPRPSKHAVAQGMFLYVYRARRQPRRGHHRRLTSSSTPSYEPIVWTQAERARGQAWGVKTIETFHTYGTPT